MVSRYTPKSLSTGLVLLFFATSTQCLCNGSSRIANATGVFTFPVNYPLPHQATRDGDIDQFIPDPSWAITVSGGNGEQIEKTLWYDTAGQNYADDLAINYDVCTFAISHLPLNAVRLGQNDNGNCSSLLSESCIKNMTDTVSNSASMWTQFSSPPPYQNLTAGVLPSICGYIYQDLQHSMINACGPEFGISVNDSFAGAITGTQALTGYNTSVLYDRSCNMTLGNKTFYSVPVSQFGFDRNVHDTDWTTGTDAGYDNATQDITPVLTVYTPVANVARTSWYSYSPSVLRCLRPSNYSEGSRVSPPLAAGTPWPKSENRKSGLNAGAKGGIGAGVAVFVLILAGLVLRLWLVRRKKRAAAVAHMDLIPSDEKSMPLEADDNHGVHELKSDDRKPELQDITVAEMEGGGSEPAELANATAPVELPGSDSKSQIR